MIKITTVILFYSSTEKISIQRPKVLVKTFKRAYKQTTQTEISNQWINVTLCHLVSCCLFVCLLLLHKLASFRLVWNNKQTKLDTEGLTFHTKQANKKNIERACLLEWFKYIARASHHCICSITRHLIADNHSIECLCCLQRKLQGQHLIPIQLLKCIGPDWNSMDKWTNDDRAR